MNRRLFLKGMPEALRRNPFLQELKSYNPLMFDFALKRLIRYQGKRFAPRAFETRMFFTSLPITKT